MKKTILMVIPNYYPIVGGAENQLRKLTKILNHELEIVILTQKYHGLKKNDKVDGVSIIRKSFLPFFGPLNEFFNSLMMFLYIYKNSSRFDVLHFHQGTFINAIISILNKKITKIKSICKIANSGEKFDLNSYRFFFNKSIKQSFIKSIDNFIAINNEINDQLLDLGASNIVNIPNGVVLNQFKIKEFNSTRKIIFCSRLVPQKNIVKILKFFIEIESNLTEFEIDIYGTGTELVKLKKLSSVFKFLKVNFYGNCEKPYENYNYGDIYINSSSYEGISNSLLEAMSCGLVSLVSDIPGNNMVITNNYNGLIFDLNNKASFINQFLRLISSKILYEELSINSHSTISKTFDLKIVTRNYINLYNKLTSENS